MLISRSILKFVARLLIGVLVLAQVALAAYACPPTPVTSMSAPAGDLTMGARPTTAQTVAVIPVSWRMDTEQPNLCIANCQAGQQVADLKPAPTPPLALVAGYFTLAPVMQGAGLVPPDGAAPEPPPLADPPHAILHCCLRI